MFGNSVSYFGTNYLLIMVNEKLVLKNLVKHIKSRSVPASIGSFGYSESINAIAENDTEMIATIKHLILDVQRQSSHKYSAVKYFAGEEGKQGKKVNI